MNQMWRHPLLVIVAPCLRLGVVRSTVTPLFEAPDERQHYQYVQHLASRCRLPPWAGSSLAEHEGSQPPLYCFVAALATAWRRHDLSLFAVGDALGVPVHSWAAGDIIVQEHRLAGAPVRPLEEWWIELGAYALPTVERLPVSDRTGTPLLGDAIRLPAIGMPGAQ